MKPIEEHFRDWECEVFGFGYGSGEEHVLAAVKKFMETVGVGRDDAENAYDYKIMEEALGQTVTWLLINTFGHWAVIEYGTSPRYGWLTKEGIALRDFMKSKSLEELVALAADGDEPPDCCTRTFCNCGPVGYSEKKLCFNPFWVNRQAR